MIHRPRQHLRNQHPAQQQQQQQKPVQQRVQANAAEGMISMEEGTSEGVVSSLFRI